MELGYRIMRPEDVGKQPLTFAQISLWRIANWDVAEGERAVTEAIEMAAACKARGIRTVYHPLEYPLTGEHASETPGVLRRLAAKADLGIIIHDEGGAGGKRLTPGEERTFEEKLAGISSLCPVSLENSFNSGDITRFWERFVAPAPDSVSITLDIGHLELAGLHSTKFVRDLPRKLIERIRFVHMHHHDAGDLHPVKDHKPLIPGCREIDALNVLRERKKDLWVILELDAAEKGMRESIGLLREPGMRTAGRK
jgi:sugar phosphate isomerase/epimerase